MPFHPSCKPSHSDMLQLKRDTQVVTHQPRYTLQPEWVLWNFVMGRDTHTPQHPQKHDRGWGQRKAHKESQRTCIALFRASGGPGNAVKLYPLPGTLVPLRRTSMRYAPVSFTRSCPLTMPASEGFSGRVATSARERSISFQANSCATKPFRPPEASVGRFPKLSNALTCMFAQAVASINNNTSPHDVHPVVYHAYKGAVYVSAVKTAQVRQCLYMLPSKDMEVSIPNFFRIMYTSAMFARATGNWRITSPHRIHASRVYLELPNTLNSSCGTLQSCAGRQA
jgi:hypothetical protein